MNDMNLPVAKTGNDIAEVNSAASLILGPSWERIQSFAQMMSKGAVSVPQHLRGKEADCCAIAMQALGWGMNPFAVAQKTHVTQGGIIGYESQLINAVIQNSGALDGSPDYQWFGDWNRIAGKVVERTSDKTQGKYYVPGWQAADEEGLGVKVRATLRGESAPRELSLLLKQCYPRFSTQWATDPKQQIAYLALRKFVRLHKPGVILGVYSDDEFDSAPPEKEINPPASAAPAGPPAYPKADFDKNLPQWTKLIQTGKKSADDIITMVSTKGTLSEAQMATLRAIKPPIEGEATKEAALVVDPVKLRDRLEKAADLDVLTADADLISQVADEAVRKDLTAVYQARREALEGGAQ